MDMLFLRLARRRTHAALKTIIAHGKDAISQEIIMVETLRWFEEADARELAVEWQKDLNNLRTSSSSPAPKPKTRGRRKKRMKGHVK